MTRSQILITALSRVKGLTGKCDDSYNFETKISNTTFGCWITLRRQNFVCYSGSRQTTEQSLHIGAATQQEEIKAEQKIQSKTRSCKSNPLQAHRNSVFLLCSESVEA